MNVLRQGQGDGLCGLYVFLANFLENYDDWGVCGKGTAESTLRYLLDVCEIHGWLSSLKLCHGFDGPNLVTVANTLSDAYWLDFRAGLIESTNFAHEPSLSKLANNANVLGAIVGSKHHWILLLKDSDKAFVSIDSLAGEVTAHN